jgi:hypothetical protein
MLTDMSTLAPFFFSGFYGVRSRPAEMAAHLQSSVSPRHISGLRTLEVSQAPGIILFPDIFFLHQFHIIHPRRLSLLFLHALPSHSSFTLFLHTLPSRSLYAPLLS